MALPAIAFKYFHDVYYPGVEDEFISRKAVLWNKIKRQIRINQMLTFVGLSSKNRVSVIIFKEMPSSELVQHLKTEGFAITHLPSNGQA